MKVISTNVANIKSIKYRGKTVETGIFKKSTLDGIFLAKEDVVNDNVVDRRFHGGIDKACYLYSKNHYSYWEKHFPSLNFEYGMFGENLTIEGLFEKDIFIGDVFEIGEALVEVSQAREPCFKLGVKFGTQKIVKQFYDSDFPGIYVRILKEGKVKKNDKLKLVERREQLVTVLEVFSVFRSSFIKDFTEEKKSLINKVLKSNFLAKKSKMNVQKVYNRMYK